MGVIIEWNRDGRALGRWMRTHVCRGAATLALHTEIE